MTATLKLNISQLDQDLIDALRAQYVGADIEINIQEQAAKSPLSEEAFWSIIALLDWQATSNNAIIQPAIEHLTQLSIPAIYRFQDLLAEKLYALDQKKYAVQLGYSEEGHFSVDSFLYARACVVANGASTYDAVLKEEMEMPKSLTFEPLLSVASKAYHIKTGKPFIYIPRRSYETFSNQKGWA